MQMKRIDLPELASAFSAASDVMLAAILDQSADCIKVISKHGTVDYMNRNGQCAMEIDDFCAVAGQNWSALWPEKSRSLIEGSMEKARRANQVASKLFVRRLRVRRAGGMSVFHRCDVQTANLMASSPHHET